MVSNTKYVTTNQPQIKIEDETDEYASDAEPIKNKVLNHIGRIGEICCKELIPGYWEKIPVKIGDGIVFTEKYHEDTREAYCTAVDWLRDMVEPDGDDEFKTEITKIDQENPKDKGEKVAQRRKIFKQIQFMFNRTNYFGSSTYKE